MTTIERSPEKLVLRSGSTVVVLDKAAGNAILERKFLFWRRRPLERPLAAITNVRVHTMIDPPSKAEICSTLFVLAEGGGWLLSAGDKADATDTVVVVRDFLSSRSEPQD